MWAHESLYTRYLFFQKLHATRRNKYKQACQQRLQVGRKISWQDLKLEKGRPADPRALKSRSDRRLISNVKLFCKNFRRVILPDVSLKACTSLSDDKPIRVVCPGGGALRELKVNPLFRTHSVWSPQT